MNEIVYDERNPHVDDRPGLFSASGVFEEPEAFEHEGDVEKCCCSHPSGVHAEPASHADKLKSIDLGSNRLPHHHKTSDEHDNDVDEAKRKAHAAICSEDYQPDGISQHIDEENVTNIFKDKLVVS